MSGHFTDSVDARYVSLEVDTQKRAITKLPMVESAGVAVTTPLKYEQVGNGEIVRHADAQTNDGYPHAELQSLRVAVDLVPGMGKGAERLD